MARNVSRYVCTGGAGATAGKPALAAAPAAADLGADAAAAAAGPGPPSATAPGLSLKPRSPKLPFSDCLADAGVAMYQRGKVAERCECDCDRGLQTVCRAERAR